MQSSAINRNHLDEAVDLEVLEPHLSELFSCERLLGLKRRREHFAHKLLPLSGLALANLWKQGFEGDQGCTQVQSSTQCPPVEPEAFEWRLWALRGALKRRFKCNQMPSRGHQEAIQMQSDAIKRPSRGHQEAIKRPSRGNSNAIRCHQEAIKRPSRGHQEAIKRPSRGHHTFFHFEPMAGLAAMAAA